MSYQQQVFSLIAKLGGSKDKAVVDPTLCRFMGGLEGGVFLAQLLYWSDKGDGESFYKSYREWEDEIFLSKYQVNRAAKQCIELGFLETTVRKANGSPTVHYRIIKEKLVDCLIQFVEMESQKFNFPSSNFGKTESQKFDDPKENFSLSLTETTTETTIETTAEREQPTPPTPAETSTVEIKASNGANGKLIYKSPHINKKHFVDGFVPAGTGATAVEVYYERFDITSNAQRLTPVLEDDLVRNCPDLELLREVVTAYHRRGYKNERNIDLILDWYKDPSRFRKDTNHAGTSGRNGNSNGNGYQRPDVAQFTKAEWQEWLANRPEEERPPF